MSAFVEETIKEKAEGIKKETIEAINRVAETATRRFNQVIETLKEQAKIILPVNIIDILAKGGYVKAVELNVPYTESLNFQLADRYIFGEEKLQSGKYRVTLIFERLGPPEPKKDC